MTPAATSPGLIALGSIGSVLSLTNGVWFCSSFFIALSAWTLVRKRGEPVSAAPVKA